MDGSPDRERCKQSFITDRETRVKHLLNLDRYPLDRPESRQCAALVEYCKETLARDGLFNLTDFVRPEALVPVVANLQPLIEREAFVHARRHNIYFKPGVDGLESGHPALAEFETSNRTICADQMVDNPVIQLYEWRPFIQFLAAVMNRPQLFPMEDDLARVNVMAYSEGQALNWHFDRSEFTTTLLLQAPEAGGAFEYDRDIRSDDDPNYDGVASLLAGRGSPTQMTLEPGTLNVFKGRNTAHRVSPVLGQTDRIIVVFSYYEKPGVTFSGEERIGFYGRAN